MQSTTTIFRRLAFTAGLALTALAASATGAAGGLRASSNEALTCNARAQACMSTAAYRALMIRSEALNRKYGLGG